MHTIQIFEKMGCRYLGRAWYETGPRRKYVVNPGTQATGTQQFNTYVVRGNIKHQVPQRQHGNRCTGYARPRTVASSVYAPRTSVLTVAYFSINQRQQQQRQHREIWIEPV